MKRIGIGALALLAVTAVTGCASDMHPKANYNSLPGSGDHMAAGPGLFHAGQDQDYQDGYRVFSDNPSQPALVHPHGTGGSQSVAQGSATATPAAASSQPPTASQQQQYRQFEEYQQYKQFQQMPKDSAEYQKFREWQDWKQYQQWKNSSGQ